MSEILPNKLANIVMTPSYYEVTGHQPRPFDEKDKVNKTHSITYYNYEGQQSKGQDNTDCLEFFTLVNPDDEDKNQNGAYIFRIGTTNDGGEFTYASKRLVPINPDNGVEMSYGLGAPWYMNLPEDFNCCSNNGNGEEVFSLIFNFAFFRPLSYSGEINIISNFSTSGIGWQLYINKKDRLSFRVVGSGYSESVSWGTFPLDENYYEYDSYDGSRTYKMGEMFYNIQLIGSWKRNSQRQMIQLTVDDEPQEAKMIRGVEYFEITPEDSDNGPKMKWGDIIQSNSVVAFIGEIDVKGFRAENGEYTNNHYHAWTNNVFPEVEVDGETVSRLYSDAAGETEEKEDEEENEG